MLPLVGREIPIVADEYSDPEKGSGAVKITPAHDFNDYRGRQAARPARLINIFDATAQLNDEVPEKYRGLDRFDARKRVVADLEALGLVEKIEPHAHAVPHAQRGNAVVEPWLTDQWYVERGRAGEAGDRRGRERQDASSCRKNWEKTYFEWMRNIQPWCISRQIWWGHQIPAWYGPDGKDLRCALDESSSQRPSAQGERCHGPRGERRGLRQRKATDAALQARRGRARHVVLLRAVAVLDAGLAGQDARSSSASIRPACSSPASTSSSSGSRA